MNMLKDYVNYKLTHADKVAEAESYPLTLTNCKKYKKMRDLKVYGNSLQDGTPTPDAPVEVVSVGEKSVNMFCMDKSQAEAKTVGGLTFTPLDDERVYVKGTATENVYYYINTKPTKDMRLKSGTYKSKSQTQNKVTAIIFGCRYLDGTSAGNIHSNSSSGTINGDAYIESVLIYITKDTIIDNIVEIQLMEGTKDLPYEPYGKYKLPVVSRGINLFSMAKSNFTTTTINGITYTPLGDERVHIKGKLADTTKSAYYQPSMKSGNFIKAGKYRSKPNNYTWSGLALLYQIRKDGNFMVNINTSVSAVNVPEDGYINNILIGVDAGNTREWDDIIELQLMEGTEDLPYEPYVEPVTTNIFLDEPLRKLGDYEDYIDFKENKVIRHIRERVLDGVSAGRNITHITQYSNGLYYSLCGEQTSIANGAENVLKNTHFKAVQSVAKGQCYMTAGGTACLMVHSNQELNTISLWNEWLKEQYNNGTPVIFDYVLKEPIEEPLNIDLPKLTAKTTIIEVDTSLAPSNAYGKYIKK